MGVFVCVCTATFYRGSRERYTNDPIPGNPASAPHLYLVQVYHTTFLEFIEKNDLQLEWTKVSGTVERNSFWTGPASQHRNTTMGCFEIMLKGTRCPQRNDGFNICGLELSHKLNRAATLKNMSRLRSPPNSCTVHCIGRNI